MAIPNFVQGYPLDGSTLGQTKSTIRNNLDGTFLTVGVDHINNNGLPGSRPAGYHNVIHIVPQGSNPAPIAGYGQLFSKTVTTSMTVDQQLFWETGTGLVSQITAAVTPSPTSPGYTYLPGGILLQWGSITGSPIANSAVVSFPISFGTVFAATLGGATNSSNASNPINIRQSTLDQSGFTVSTASSSYLTLYWMAIGTVR